MTHPFAGHRQTKVEHSRVGHITKGYASGGAVPTAGASSGVGNKSTPAPAMKASGGAVKPRADRPNRAKGGRVKGKNAKTNINVIVAPQGTGHTMGAAPPPVGPPPGGPMPAPPMRPPMAGPPPGVGAMPLGGPPMPPPGIRSVGGRAYAKGGAVKLGPAFAEGKRLGTQVSHDPGKNDGKDIGRGKPITYKVGGRVESPEGVAPATKLPGGSGGGVGRVAKAKRAAREYARA